MNFTTLNGDRIFWNDFSQWYEKWVSRGEYHRLIINEISYMVEPGWEVLDIGAGTGAFGYISLFSSFSKKWELIKSNIFKEIY